MSGRAISLESFMGTNLRVAGQLTFVPAHIDRSGKQINARASIPVRANRKRRGVEKTNTYTLTAWGPLAETCCKSCPPGKALDVRGEPRSFEKKLFRFDNGSIYPVLDAAGNQVTVKNFLGITIREICFGEESAKQIDKEIQENKRPANWNVPGHPDYQMWLDMLKARQAMKFEAGMTSFGYARVHVPEGVQIVRSEQSAPVAQVGQTMTGYVGQSMPQQVQQAVNAQPVQNPAPVYTAATQAPVNAPASGQIDLF